MIFEEGDWVWLWTNRGDGPSRIKRKGSLNLALEVMVPLKCWKESMIMHIGLSP